ncbi:MAG: ribonuclease P protein subunit [Candidatus Micrarchaeota archaeon]|nr:ribonuclease P protein subunit [Candidatus Micrarchaeota archaeon]
MITAENLRLHELIGLHAKVAESLSVPHKGIRGLVVDETKNTLVIRAGKEEKIVPKKGSVFLFTLPGREKVRLEGDKIAYRPYDRPKKLR